MSRFIFLNRAIKNNEINEMYIERGSIRDLVFQLYFRCASDLRIDYTTAFPAQLFFLCAQLFLIGCLSNQCLCSQLEPRVKCPGLLSRLTIFFPPFNLSQPGVTRFRFLALCSVLNKR